MLFFDVVTEKNDEDELDPLVVILLPITVLVGFLALLSIVSKCIMTPFEKVT